MNAAVISTQGECSLHMEDRYFLDLDFLNQGFIYGGVYDGHGGFLAAEYVSLNLHKRFESYLEGSSPDISFVKAYETISNEITTDMGGTCAVDFFIKGKELWYANAGDCRVVAIGKGIRQLTLDHTIAVPKERERVEKAGGSIRGTYVAQGYRTLSVSRSLGDQYHKEVGVIATPDVGSYTIRDDDRFLIVASDGLFKKVSNEEIASIARIYNDANVVATKLKDKSLENGSEDNITILVLGLH